MATLLFAVSDILLLEKQNDTGQLPIEESDTYQGSQCPEEFVLLFIVVRQGCDLTDATWQVRSCRSITGHEETHELAVLSQTTLVKMLTTFPALHMHNHLGSCQTNNPRMKCKPTHCKYKHNL